MKRKHFPAIAFAVFIVALILGTAHPAQAQSPAADSKPSYPSMAPVDQYLMDRDAEIALARSAGPDFIARDAEILVLTSHGYETAVKGKNGFTCLIERGWTATPDDPNFWNPKLHGPLCLNAAAVRSYLPITIKKTDLVLRDHSKEKMMEGIRDGIAKKQLPTPEPGAMSYMLSKDGYLGDGNGHWRPHLMFFIPLTNTETWGANETGSQVYGVKLPNDSLTLFFVPVSTWSDGTPDTSDHH